MKTKCMLAGVLALSLLGCKKEIEPPVLVNKKESLATGTLGLVGDPADVSRSTSGGSLLMGGGPDVDAAMQWLISKSGGGDIVVLRASGSNAYNSYIYGLGTVNSVETLLINSRTLANDPEVEAKIRAAEAVFIAGGDQSTYVNFWKNTKVEDALNYLRNTKGCVIGGTSAGNAIQGSFYYAALNGSVISSAALRNPYNTDMTLGANDFLDQPYLSDLIMDTHFNNPDRRGRLMAFMARMSKDYGILPYGIGVEEETAVCVSSDGSSKVYGVGYAHFLKQNTSSGTPERCVSGSSLDWYRAKQAVKCYKVPGTSGGSNTFNFSSWTGSGGTSLYYYIDRGAFKTF